ncbi:MAG: hypothetical protein H6631_15385 [Anaerolineaceae bacterium]|nr:hypothetical protein [Anaerolineaceae bacterium]MCB9102153.1 hypothetical protein [Anaerolineales bacterium]
MSSSFEEQVKQLTIHDLYTIQTQYDAAMDTEHGSGEHWLLIAALNQKGFHVRSVEQAIDTAEQIIVLWRQLNG